MADKIKFLLAVGLLMAGVVGFYAFPEGESLKRGAALVAGVIAALAVLWFSESRIRFLAFVRDVVLETKKVVWPSRKETVQTTGIIFAFVVVMAAYLWVADKSLEWLLYDLVLGWK